MRNESICTDCNEIIKIPVAMVKTTKKNLEVENGK